MVRCVTVTFVLSGVVLAGMCYLLYTPLPPHLGNWWTLQVYLAKFRASFIYAEFKHRLLSSDRLANFRDAMDYNFQIPLTSDDKAMLEIYDTRLNGVSVRIYKPKSTKGPLPGLVFYHGGGWAVLNVPAYDGVCARIARKSNIIVISVEYRLAPEFPFPAGFNDCFDVAVYALQEGKKLGLDTSRIAVGGDSAGGNLAAAVTLKLRDDKVKPSLKAHLLIYGCLQFCDMNLPCAKLRDPYDPNHRTMYAVFVGYYLNMTQSQVKLMINGTYLTPEMQKKCDKYVDYKLLPKNLLPDNHVRPGQLATEINDDVKYIDSLLADPRVAPLMAKDLTNLPPTFVLAAEWDSLRDENLIYAERLKRAGNKVRVLFLDDSFHGILSAFDYERHGFDAGPRTMNGILSFVEEELK